MIIDFFCHGKCGQHLILREEIYEKIIQHPIDVVLHHVLDQCVVFFFPWKPHKDIKYITAN